MSEERAKTPPKTYEKQMSNVFAELTTKAKPKQQMMSVFDELKAKAAPKFAMSNVFEELKIKVKEEEDKK